MFQNCKHMLLYLPLGYNKYMHFMAFALYKFPYGLTISVDIPILSQVINYQVSVNVCWSLNDVKMTGVADKGSTCIYYERLDWNHHQYDSFPLLVLPIFIVLNSFSTVKQWLFYMYTAHNSFRYTEKMWRSFEDWMRRKTAPTPHTQWFFFFKLKNY